MPPRGLNAFPVEIQTMILTEVVSKPYPNDGRSRCVELVHGLSCRRVCSMYNASFIYLMLVESVKAHSLFSHEYLLKYLAETWNGIVTPLLPKLLPSLPFLTMRLETFSFEAIWNEILKRKEMIAKVGSRGNMSDDAFSEFDKLIRDLRNSLVFAVYWGFIACTKGILENVPELSEMHNSTYILHEVANIKKPEVLKLLLDQDWILKDIEQRNVYGNTPLGNAAHGRNYQSMEILMDYGASTDIKPSSDRALSHYLYYSNLQGGRLLTFATIKGDAKMLDLLLRRGLKPEWEENNYEDTHLTIALKKNNLEMAQTLLDHGANVRFEQHREIYPVNSAIESCGLQTVKKLIDLGAVYQGSHFADALFTAVTHNRQDVFTFLLERGAILKSFHLDLAIGHSLRIAAQILDIDGVEYAGPAFIRACGEGHKDFVRVFIDHGVDPNSKDICGTLSALEVAADASDTDIVRMLLNAGADATRISRGILLSSAVLDENMEILKILLDGGAYANEEIQRPLLKAVRTRRNSAVRILLENGADVNQFGRAYQTPLSTANDMGENDLCELLTSWGGLTTEDLRR